MGNELVQISMPGAPQPKDRPEFEGDAQSSPENSRTFYIETFGCQMNVHDSEKVAGTLVARGYRAVESHDEADLILYNTCSIREKAAEKVFSHLGALKKA